jgi:hypothetical protein
MSSLYFDAFLDQIFQERSSLCTQENSSTVPFLSPAMWYLEHLLLQKQLTAGLNREEELPERDS